MVDKIMIIMHIVAYLALIGVDALQYMKYCRSLRAYEISAICGLVVYFVCTVIFGLILN